mmetsp:Transcript_8397/g.21472  ORF Transcript_8397/g.21472 Transcript_8397/m.21472 type:complete len:257 (+) Transcript_8397:86-856(+)
MALWRSPEWRWRAARLLCGSESKRSGGASHRHLVREDVGNSLCGNGWPVWETAFREEAHGLHEARALQGLHFRLERLWRLPGVNLDALLYHNGSAVDLRGNDMHSASRLLVACCDGRFVDLQIHAASVLGKQTRVDVDTTMAPHLTELRAQDAHETHQHHEIDGLVLEDARELGVVGGTFGALLAWQVQCADAIAFAALQNTRIALVRHDQSNLCRQSPVLDSVNRHLRGGASCGADQCDAHKPGHGAVPDVVPEM